MRVVVVETDADGRSCVGRFIERGGPISEETAHPIFSGRIATAAHPSGTEGFLDLSPGAGAAIWRIYEFPPSHAYEMHHTDTVDFDVLVDGAMTLVLDHQEIELTPGDGVLLRGDRHGWRAGDAGCRMVFALLGSSQDPLVE